MGSDIHLLEAEDAALLEEPIVQAPIPFQHFYINLIHYYQHFIQQVGNIDQYYKEILDQV